MISLFSGKVAHKMLITGAKLARHGRKHDVLTRGQLNARMFHGGQRGCGDQRS